jgi:glycosyltransferase involved in cell wall biosynthesis
MKAGVVQTGVSWARKPKLLFVGSFVIGHREQGGQHAQCMQLVESPLREQCAFLLLDSTPPYLPPPPAPIRTWLAARRLARLVRILPTWRPDAMLIFSSGGLSFLEKGMMALLARGWRVPVIWSVRAGVFQTQVEKGRLFRVVARRLLRAPRRILCQGESWAEFYRMRLGIPEAALFVLPNWIGPNRFSGIQTEARLSRPGLRVLFVGHVKLTKGVYELAKALLDTPELADVDAEFVGDGEDRQALVDLVRKHGAEHRVRLVGWRTGEDLAAHYGGADVFVLPSHAEGFPNVLLEAMAAGLPVISTAVGGIPDVIKHGTNGLLVPVGDVGALATAIATLQSDPVARERMGKVNREAVTNHSVERAASRLWDELTSISPAFAAAARSATAKEPAFAPARDHG